MNAPQTINKHLIANDFRLVMHGRLEPRQIEEAMQSLVTARQAYPAIGSLASRVFYLQCQISVLDGRAFDGQIGRIASPGGGALVGRVHTDDLERLYGDTASFTVQSTPHYLSLLYFDRHSRLLGHFQCGPVALVHGLGGGQGGWD